MTTEQLAALKEVAKRATPGPWHKVDNRVDLVREIAHRLNWEDDAAFIAAFDPTTCLELLEEVERPRKDAK